MTESKLKQANELDKTIKDCNTAIKYLKAPCASLSCKYTNPSTSTTSNNHTTYESLYVLPMNKEAREILISHYESTLRLAEKAFGEL